MIKVVSDEIVKEYLYLRNAPRSLRGLDKRRKRLIKKIKLGVETASAEALPIWETLLLKTLKETRL